MYRRIGMRRRELLKPEWLFTDWRCRCTHHATAAAIEAEPSMRDVISSGDRLLLRISLCFLALVLNAQVKAEQRSAPWDSVGCNETCRWWMNLGGKPAADIKPPPPSGSSPALSAKAIVPDAALAAAGASALGATVMRRPGVGTTGPAGSRQSRKGSGTDAASTPERPAFIPGQSLWNFPISGSAPVLPASLLTSP